jgi:ubiquinone/menaquinone biosynthesis C-methylase UbiE
MPGTKYDTIGVGYDGTRRADPRIADRLLALLQPSRTAGRFLDVACGTGNYTSYLAGAGLAMTGVDQSDTMLAVARAKCPGGEWHRASADALPFADATFLGAVCTNAVHHFDNLPLAFREIARVLCADGRFVILTSTPEQMRSYWLNAYFPAAMRQAIEEMPSRDVVEAALTEGGMRLIDADPYAVPRDAADLFLYAGKYRPALYLDPAVRAGISTFAVADARRTARGVERLRRDIETGQIDHVMDTYRKNNTAAGDYIFYTAQRTV